MRLLVLLALVCVIASTPLRPTQADPLPPALVDDAAATKAPTLGPAPVKCFPAGCYGGDFGPNYMDNTSVGELDLAPHIVQPDQMITANVAFGDWKSSFCNDVDPAHWSEEPRHTCSFKVGSSSGTTWGRLSAHFCSFGCGIEQDFYYVLPSNKTAITGMVRRADGSGVKGAKIEIKGPKNYFAITEAGGFYQAVNIPQGRYTVTGPEDFCAIDPLRRYDQGEAAAACSRSRTVDVTQRTAAVDFDEQAYTVSGTVEQQNCTDGECTFTPLGGIPLEAKLGKTVRSTSTGGDGKFSMRLGKGAWTIRPTSTDRTFNPAALKVHVTGSDRTGQDFVQCASPSAQARSRGPEASASPADKCPIKLKVFIYKRDGTPTNLGSVVNVKGPTTVRQAQNGYNDYTHFLLKPGSYRVNITPQEPLPPGLARPIYCHADARWKIIKPCSDRAEFDLHRGQAKPKEVRFVKTNVCDRSGFRPFPSDPPPSAGLSTAAQPVSISKDKQMRLIGGGQSVEFKIVKPGAADVKVKHRLWVVSPFLKEIGAPNEVGKVVKIPLVAKNQEIILQLCVNDDLDDRNYVFTSGPGSRNEDGLMHAKLFDKAGGVVRVKWEDTYKYNERPDDDFDEFVVDVRGVSFGGKIYGRLEKLNEKLNFVPATGVTVVLDGDKKRPTKTDETGRYLFKDLEEGSYTVSVPKGFCAAPFRSQNKKHADCHEKKMVTLGGERNQEKVDFEQESFRLRVILKDRSDDATHHEGVFVRADGTPGTPGLPGGSTNKSGLKNFGQVPYGTYKVSLRFPHQSPLRNTPICVNEKPTLKKCERSKDFRIDKNTDIEATAMSGGKITLDLQPIDGSQNSIRTGFSKDKNGKFNFYDPDGRICRSACAAFDLKVDVKNPLEPKQKVTLDIHARQPGGFKQVKPAGDTLACVLEPDNAARDGFKLIDCGTRVKVDVTVPVTLRIEYWPASLGAPSGNPVDGEIRVNASGKDLVSPEQEDETITVRPRVLVDVQQALGAWASVIEAAGAWKADPRPATANDFIDRLNIFVNNKLVDWIGQHFEWVKKLQAWMKSATQVPNFPVVAVKYTFAYSLMTGPLEGKTEGLGTPSLSGFPPSLGWNSDFFDALLAGSLEMIDRYRGLRISPTSNFRIRIYEASRPEAGPGEKPGNSDLQPALYIEILVDGKVIHETTVQKGYHPFEYLRSVWGAVPE